MTATTIDQTNGFSGSTALKQPVRLATTAPVALERSTTGQSGAMSEANFTNSSGFGGSGVYMV